MLLNPFTAGGAERDVKFPPAKSLPRSMAGAGGECNGRGGPVSVLFTMLNYCLDMADVKPATTISAGDRRRFCESAKSFAPFPQAWRKPKFKCEDDAVFVCPGRRLMTAGALTRWRRAMAFARPHRWLVLLILLLTLEQGYNTSAGGYYASLIERQARAYSRPERRRAHRRERSGSKRIAVARF